MAVTKNSFLVGLLTFLCLSLGSANRVLKNNDAEYELISDNVSLGQDNQLQNFSQAELESIPKGNIPKYSSVGPTNGDCCNYGNNCGGYVCPPNYMCGGNSDCPCTYSSCSWQGCQGCQGCQRCQICQGCQGCHGCQVSPPHCGCIDNDSKVQHESIQMAVPEPPTVRIVPPVQPVNQNIKSSGGANQEVKSNGGLV